MWQEFQILLWIYWLRCFPWYKTMQEISTSFKFPFVFLILFDGGRTRARFSALTSNTLDRKELQDREQLHSERYSLPKTYAQKWTALGMMAGPNIICSQRPWVFPGLYVWLWTRAAHVDPDAVMSLISLFNQRSERLILLWGSSNTERLSYLRLEHWCFHLVVSFVWTDPSLPWTKSRGNI